MVVKLYHPSNSKGKVINYSKRQESLQKCARTLCKEFGGCTVQNSVGYYLAENGEIIQEDIKILISSMKKLSLKQKSIVRNLAFDVKYELAQESVMIEFDNESDFI